MRISDKEITERIQELEEYARSYNMTASSIRCLPELLDLRDSRAEVESLKARIAEMERLSASQAEALDMADRGQL